MYKLIIYFMVIFFAFSISAMDFGDEGMSFGDEEKTEVKKKTKKVKKRVKKKKKKEEKKEDEGISFGEDSKEKKDEKTEDDGMSFGDSDEGMSFGDDSSSNLTEEDSEKINKDSMRFDFNDSDTKKLEKTTKKDIVKIKKKQENYLEKGTYFKLSYGLSTLISNPKVGGEALDSKDLMGSNVILSLGFDISDALSFELYGQMLMNSGSSEGAEGILYAKDVVSTITGLGINFNFLKSDRLNMNINLHGGAIFLEEGINGAFGGMLGMEYYLLLRHFSVLTSLNGDYIMGLDTTAISLNASVKYSF